MYYVLNIIEHGSSEVHTESNRRTTQRDNELQTIKQKKRSINKARTWDKDRTTVNSGHGQQNQEY